MHSSFAARPHGTEHVLAALLKLALSFGFLVVRPPGSSRGGNLPCTIFTPTQTPLSRPTPKTCRSSWASSSGRPGRVRLPASGSTRAAVTGHAHRLALDQLRHPAGNGNLHRRTATGWQQATFASQVAVTANTTYVASYFAPNGATRPTKATSRTPASRTRH